MARRKKLQAPSAPVGGQHYRDHIPSLAALIELINTNPQFKQQCASRSTGNDYTWDLGIDWDAALSLIHNGWVDKAAELERLMGKLSADIKTERYDLHPVVDVAGDSVDVGEYLSGEPECFTRYEAVRTKGGKLRNHNVELMVAVFCSCSVPAQTYLMRGLYVYLLARSLMMAGVNVGITLYLSVQNGNHTACHTSRMKEPDQYLDLGTLAFWLVHPCAYRRAGFAWCESRSEAERNAMGFFWGAGYGHAVQLPADAGPAGFIDIPPATLDTQAAWATEELALASIKEVLRQQGVDCS